MRKADAPFYKNVSKSSKSAKDTLKDIADYFTGTMRIDNEADPLSALNRQKDLERATQRQKEYIQWAKRTGKK